MPYEVKKMDGKFEVINLKTGKGHGATTKAKAEKQKRLLYAIDHGFRPTRRNV